MGKPTGFLEFDRSIPGDRSPKERVHDWDEFHDHLSDSALSTQGARCMDCGVPFCHTGEMIGGAAAGCPLNNLIPEWNDSVYREKWQEALERLHKTNNFPEFTGRVCPAPCEGSCVLGINEPPVTIKNIEVQIADRGFEEGWITARPPTIARSGKSVAVVGSGPAGLACAAQLNQSGHSVTVYERADRIGGLLMYGIPMMKLDKEIVLRRIKILEEEGIKFVTNADIGKNIPTQKIVEDHNAVVLCGGATQARNLPITGRELDGVHMAMEFLTANTKSYLDSQHKDGKYISAEGKHVIVIGGGDTGTDCVATSLRHGCKSLIQLEIMPEPPGERAADNPWPQWPKILRTDYGQEEAAAIFGKDPRLFAVMTKRLLGDSAGKVNSIEICEVKRALGKGGAPSFEEVPGSTKELPADLVLLAMGFVGPEKPGLLTDLGVDLDARGNVVTDKSKQTSVKGIFAAGDMSRGQSLVVWAIAEGREAAVGVERYLSSSS